MRVYDKQRSEVKKRRPFFLNGQNKSLLSKGALLPERRESKGTKKERNNSLILEILNNFFNFSSNWFLKLRCNCCCCSREELNHVGAVLFVDETDEGHVVAGSEGRRREQPLVQVGTGPLLHRQTGKCRGVAVAFTRSDTLADDASESGAHRVCLSKESCLRRNKDLHRERGNRSMRLRRFERPY